jgi:hypothetical protein
MLSWREMVLCALAYGAACGAAHAGERLQWTGAVSQVEGAAGGGLVPFALIGGLETDDQTGGSAFVTYVSTRDFSLRTAGAQLDIEDRLELSVARQRFDAGSVIPGLTLGQDIVGAKLRLAGEAVFAPDRLLPQIAVGAQWKRTLDFNQVPAAVGAARASDVDLYLAATKVYFAALDEHNLLLNLTLRRTRANQFGLLGFGGDGGNYRIAPEFAVAVWLGERLLLGGEYRAKPNDLRALQEAGAGDVFLAFGPIKSVSLTAAWVDLGPIAGKSAQSGLYLSLWLGF